MLIRRCSQVVAVDEIGTAEISMLLNMRCSVADKLIASVHGMDMEEAARKPVLGEMIRRKCLNGILCLEMTDIRGK
mgnify:CR=1 FL=1